MSRSFKSTSQRNLKKSIITKTPSASNLQVKENSSMMYTHLKCIADKMAKQYCSAPTCTAKSIFVCLDDECLCQNQHQTCQFTSISSTIKKIKTKISDPSFSIKDQINIKFDSVIKTLNQCRQSLLSEIEKQKEHLRLSGLTETEKLFIKIVENNQNCELFSASQSYELWKTVNQKSHQNVNIYQQLKKNLQSFELWQKETIQKFRKHSLNFQQQSTVKSQIYENNSILLNSSTSNSCMCTFKCSSIIVNSELTQRMIKFFGRQIVKDAKLLYRASQQKFSLEQYFKNCGQQSHTLIICRTEKDKIIGGYCPLSHEFSGKGRKDFLANEPVADVTKSSFVFSLSHNDKFELTKPSYAVYRFKTKSFIQFGEGQLKIGDASDNGSYCESLINNGAYYCSQYKDKDVNSNLRFNGSQLSQFKLKQWQVWKIFFQ